VRRQRDNDELVAQLHTALDSRIVIEQAKGVLAERASIGAGSAFEVLRRYARNHNRHLRDVCRGLIDGDVSLHDLVADTDQE
jgi:AmiR/NasT family two-component response regulator